MARLNQRSPDRIRATLPGEGQLEGLLDSWGSLWMERRNLDLSHNKQSEETHQEVSCFFLNDSPWWVKSTEPAKVCQVFLWDWLGQRCCFSSGPHDRGYKNILRKLQSCADLHCQRGTCLYIHVVSENCTSEQEPGLLQREALSGKTRQCLGGDGIGLGHLGVAGWQLAGGNGQVILC